jgi:hypothetical protein
MRRAARERPRPGPVCRRGTVASHCSDAPAAPPRDPPGLRPKNWIRVRFSPILRNRDYYFALVTRVLG